MITHSFCLEISISKEVFAMLDLMAFREVWLPDAFASMELISKICVEKEINLSSLLPESFTEVFFKMWPPLITVFQCKWRL